MEYDFRKIELIWQAAWKKNETYKIANNSLKPKFYVLDMFPYPSGIGLHVGHPLGYIASDIYSRYKRLKGFNVLHPMGFDSFGLPAEQYALETGQHPATTTEKNITTFKSQLDKIGFCYDWDRELKTSDPLYYKWTQWIFLQLFNSYFCNTQKKALPISLLIKKYETKGAMPITGEIIPGKHFTASEWNEFTKQRQEEILMNRRLAFSKYGEVNWCAVLGTVLANDEVVNGVSERGGHLVEKKKMRQWYLRITDYADRLLEGLQTVDFSDSMKEMQRNWIGKSEGAQINFEIKDISQKISIYTTRPDTIFGADFMVLAPEHELISSITITEKQEEVAKYIHYVKSRSERERIAEVKQITGCFTGAYAINSFTEKKIPIWIAEYVLAGYGTGAIMAVPCADQRDFLFAKHFNIPITNIIGSYYTGENANNSKEAILENSDFLNGLLMKDAIGIAINKMEALGIGEKKVNYRMRDAGFSRQRYWGEPFPIIWSDGIALPLDAKELPLQLPHVNTYGPGPDGEGPLANIKEWSSLIIPLQERTEKELSPNYSIMEKDNEVPGYINSSVHQWKNTISFAKQNRKDTTAEEDIIWQELRDKKIAGCKLRRQHPIAGYIPDFVCLEKKIIIEIDREYNNNEEQKLFDKGREEWLKEAGFNMIRFTNYQVNNALDIVIKDIEQAILNNDKVALNAGSNNPIFTRGTGVEVKRETSTMPGYAGSSWYFLRFMDPNNTQIFCDRKISNYWNQVDLYVGGTEHAVGHLLYSRMWTKVLFDLDLIGFDEPFKKLLNQGMIQGSSRFVYRKKNTNKFYSYDTILDELLFDKIHVDVNIVNGVELNIEAFKKWRPEYENAEFILSNDIYVCGTEVEKMSKSKYNTVNPDELCEKYGADTFRMYEMFLGPVETSKPWDTKGIEGVHRFLRKLWRLFYDDFKGPIWTTTTPAPLERSGGEAATDAELKVLHRTIKKIEEDTERFSFNTAISTFMICVNELTDLKCHKKEILQPLLILLSPYAPHISEELFQQLNFGQISFSEGDLQGGSIFDASYPTFNSSLLAETTKEYPVSINGKLRTNILLALDLEQQQVEEIILQNEIIQKWLEGNPPKKIIFVKNKMINVVI